MDEKTSAQFRETLRNAGNLDAPTALDITRQTVQAAKQAGVKPDEMRSVIDEAYGGGANEPATSGRSSK
jgi:hypothetical protein